MRNSCSKREKRQVSHFGLGRFQLALHHRDPAHRQPEQGQRHAAIRSTDGRHRSQIHRVPFSAIGGQLKIKGAVRSRGIRKVRKNVKIAARFVMGRAPRRTRGGLTHQFGAKIQRSAGGIPINRSKIRSAESSIAAARAGDRYGQAENLRARNGQELLSGTGIVEERRIKGDLAGRGGAI